MQWMDAMTYHKLPPKDRDRFDEWMEQITSIRPVDLRAKNVVVEDKEVVFGCIQKDGAPLIRRFPLSVPWPL